MARRRRKTALVSAFLTASCLVLSAGQDRAAEILSLSREAIGGPARLAAVTALSLKATTRSNLDGSRGVLGHLEVHLVLPDKFLVDREWASMFTLQIAGFNGTDLLEQIKQPGLGGWADTGLGDARTNGRALAVRQRELIRYLIAFVLTVPERYQMRFMDAGDADSGHGRADVLEATGVNDFAARLFFDKQTHRLVMITYREPPPPAGAARGTPKTGDGRPLFESVEAPEGAEDIKLLLTDYRRDDGILFPHKVKFEVGALSEEWDVSRFNVNPRLEPALFARRR